MQPESLTRRADDEREANQARGTTTDHQLIDSTGSRSTTPPAGLARRRQLDERREARIDQQRTPTSDDTSIRTATYIEADRRPNWKQDRTGGGTAT